MWGEGFRGSTPKSHEALDELALCLDGMLVDDTAATATAAALETAAPAALAIEAPPIVEAATAAAAAPAVANAAAPPNTSLIGPTTSLSLSGPTTPLSLVGPTTSLSSSEALSQALALASSAEPMSARPKQCTERKVEGGQKMYKAFLEKQGKRRPTKRPASRRQREMKGTKKKSRRSKVLRDNKNNNMGFSSS